LWYDQAKFGIFMHWGVYSVPAFDSEWLWFQWKNSTNQYINNFMQTHYKPNITYADFARDVIFKEN
jgi:alpha-L-fucosidase